MNSPVTLLKSVASTAMARLGYEVRRREPAADDALYEDYPRELLRRRAFINIGAGSFSHPHWTNLDYSSDWYGEVQGHGFVPYDLTSLAPLPLANQSIQLAYTSHTIEHVPNSAAENLFPECHRVLVPGGGLRITCPDARLL